MDTQSPLSMETSVTKDKDGKEHRLGLGDLLEDKSVPHPDVATLQVLLQEDMREAVKCLPPRQNRIINLYFGLNDKPDKTLAEIGRRHHISRDQVRVIRDKAQAKLFFNRKLRDYR
jgi:RNA polymerase primary sigma factor